jgi:hypothetical protein
LACHCKYFFHHILTFSFTGVVLTKVHTKNSDGDERPRAYVVCTSTSRQSLAESDVLDFVNTRVAKIKRITGGVVLTDTIPKSPVSFFFSFRLCRHFIIYSDEKDLLISIQIQIVWQNTSESTPGASSGGTRGGDEDRKP